MLPRWLTIKKDAVICSGFVGALYLLLFALSAQATFYEIRGAVSWKNKAFKNVEAHLLYDRLPLENDIHKEGISRDLLQNGFSEEFALLEKKRMSFGFGPETKNSKELKEKLRKDFKSLVKKYQERKIGIGKKGEFYLNVSPESLYFVVVFKKKGLFEQDKNLQFWIEKIYFRPGEVMNPRELVLNESNITTW